MLNQANGGMGAKGTIFHVPYLKKRKYLTRTVGIASEKVECDCVGWFTRDPISVPFVLN